MSGTLEAWQAGPACPPCPPRHLALSRAAKAGARALCAPLLLADSPPVTPPTDGGHVYADVAQAVAPEADVVDLGAGDLGDELDAACTGGREEMELRAQALAAPPGWQPGEGRQAAADGALPRCSYVTAMRPSPNRIMDCTGRGGAVAVSPGAQTSSGVAQQAGAA